MICILIKKLWELYIFTNNLVFMPFGQMLPINGLDLDILSFEFIYLFGRVSSKIMKVIMLIMITYIERFIDR